MGLHCSGVSNNDTIAFFKDVFLLGWVYVHTCGAGGNVDRCGSEIDSCQVPFHYCFWIYVLVYYLFLIEALLLSELDSQILLYWLTKDLHVFSYVCSPICGVIGLYHCSGLFRCVERCKLRSTCMCD